MEDFCAMVEEESVLDGCGIYVGECCVTIILLWLKEMMDCCVNCVTKSVNMSLKRD